MSRDHAHWLRWLALLLVAILALCGDDCGSRPRCQTARIWVLCDAAHDLGQGDCHGQPWQLVIRTCATAARRPTT